MTDLEALRLIREIAWAAICCWICYQLGNWLADVMDWIERRRGGNETL